ncbi:hypothetical protein [Acinetobacter sp. AS23]|uniref:hypothetical protein n=1 Tax=Acinetobacter sp. AS23 TaxID=2871688 RepID=UPI00202681BC|nr:hypothetical protein [Acinetobacter sp. AS23]URM40016.1 hypothetical protein K6I41_13700 [Acinetobacter sp. AS23]
MNCASAEEGIALFSNCLVQPTKVKEITKQEDKKVEFLIFRTFSFLDDHEVQLVQKIHERQ